MWYPRVRREWPFFLSRGEGEKSLTILGRIASFCLFNFYLCFVYLYVHMCVCARSHTHTFIFEGQMLITLYFWRQGLTLNLELTFQLDELASEPLGSDHLCRFPSTGVRPPCPPFLWFLGIQVPFSCLHSNCPVVCPDLSPQPMLPCFKNLHL